MKITKSYLIKVIKEETSRYLKEENENREMLNIFVDLHNALIKKEKTLNKKIKLVDDSLSFEDILNNVKEEKNMSAYDLYEELNNYKEEIDSNMFQRLHDAFLSKIYEEDSEHLQEPEEDQDTFDKKMSDMYHKTTGKPDLTLVK